MPNQLQKLKDNQKALDIMEVKPERWRNCFKHLGWEKCQKTCPENIEGWCHYKWVAIPAFIWAVETTEGINHENKS